MSNFIITNTATDWFGYFLCYHLQCESFQVGSTIFLSQKKIWCSSKTWSILSWKFLLRSSVSLSVVWETIPKICPHVILSLFQTRLFRSFMDILDMFGQFFICEFILANCTLFTHKGFIHSSDCKDFYCFQEYFQDHLIR